jgi:hypothetical protein
MSAEPGKTPTKGKVNLQYVVNRERNSDEEQQLTDFFSDASGAEKREVRLKTLISQ